MPFVTTVFTRPRRGILAVVDATGTTVGYTINGFGKDEEIIVLSSGQ